MTANEERAKFERTLVSCSVGADSLGAAARADLDVHGYHVFPGILDAAWLGEPAWVATRSRP